MRLDIETIAYFRAKPRAILTRDRDAAMGTFPVGDPDRHRTVELVSRHDAERVVAQQIQDLNDRAIRAETLLKITTETLEICRARIVELEAEAARVDEMIHKELGR